MEARRARFWRPSAPKAVAADDHWATWMEHLHTRRTPQPLESLCATDRSPLKWGLALQQLSPRTLELLEIVEGLVAKPKGKSRATLPLAEKTLARWLKESNSLPQTIDFALECLAVAHALPQLANRIAPARWWELVDALWQVTGAASDWRSDAELPPEQGLAQQLLAGELPLTLAYLLPEMRPVHKLRADAHEALSEGLVELLNGQGLVRGPYLKVFRPLLACWTRCRAMGEQLKKGCWNRKAEAQYQWLVSQAICLSSADGQSLLGGPHGKPWTPDFLRTVLEQGGDRADLTAARSIFAKKLTRTLTGKEDRRYPEHSDHCEWSSVAIMRTDWRRSAPTVAVDYSAPELQLEVWAGPRRVVSGTWTWQTTVDGQPLEPIGSWEEVCWFSDDDVDYLELSIELAGGARLERQILLARDELFLLLADYVLDAKAGVLRHQYRLPIDDRLAFQGEKETRDACLTAGKPLVRVLPLALPEWRSDKRIGELTFSNSQLQLEQQRSGQNIACPLLLDLHKPRTTKACTWRQLTVAESLEIQSPEVAVGYRAQCGKQQWLIYRSLASPANRTLLGQNFSTESVVARFLAPAGEIDELLEVEG